MDDPLSTSCEKTMFYFRLLAFVVLSVVFIYSLVSFGGSYFLYFTYWGVFLTMLLFGFILLSYKIHAIRKMIYEMIPTLWAVNCYITLFFWLLLSMYLSDDEITLLVNSILAHSVPFVANSIELFASHVEVRRIHPVYSELIFIVYVLCVNLPYTLAEGEIYPDMDYTNLYTYVAGIGSMVLILGLGYLSYWLKKKTAKGKVKDQENI